MPILILAIDVPDVDPAAVDAGELAHRLVDGNSAALRVTIHHATWDRPQQSYTHPLTPAEAEEFLDRDV